jgi:hypothetical protein
MAIVMFTGKPSTGMSMDFQISHCSHCGQLKKSVPGAITGKPYYYPHSAAGCTPPVENSNPSGASEGADGQGACIPRYSLTYSEGSHCLDDGTCDFPTCIGCDAALVVQTGFVAADAVVLLRSLLARGVSPVTVTVLP